MASTKEITNPYSSKLDTMALFIRDFLSRELDEDTKNRTYKAIEDFCYNNSTSFKNTFVSKIGLEKLPSVVPAHPQPELLDQFIEQLTQLKGECVFLLKDTQSVLKKYQIKTNKGYGLLVNRKFVCDGDEERYFTLIELIYDVLANAQDVNAFLDTYLKSFNDLLEKDSSFKENAEHIYNFIKDHSDGKIIWVDLGFQFTFNLFCYGAIHYFSHGSIKQDFYNFTTYPWLQDFFKGKYFTIHNELALDCELEGIKAYYHDLKDKAAGALVGFAIGDSLGFPVAGIDTSDIPQFLDGEITDFTSNPKHPYFSHLKPGQYTDNTRLMMQTAENIIEHRGFDLTSYLQSPKKLGKELLEDPDKERWIGPTAFQAIKNLLYGVDYTAAGSTTTRSCSATYRVIPLGIYYRFFYNPTSEELAGLARTVAMITHNSDISKTGAALVALILADLMRGVLPKTVIKAALQAIDVTDENKLLIDNVQKAVELSKNGTIEEARNQFGTGSPIYQTLPLALFCLLKYKYDFEAAVLAAANSYRDDTPEEKKRLEDMSWEEQLIAAEGGNTDGIAGLTGVFMGAHLGLGKIPVRFLQVEHSEILIRLGQRLAK